MENHVAHCTVCNKEVRKAGCFSWEHVDASATYDHGPVVSEAVERQYAEAEAEIADDDSIGDLPTGDLPIDDAENDGEVEDEPTRRLADRR